MAKREKEEDFTARPGELENVPLLLGLEGPPGGGKTFSALRLAKGIQRVRGGRIKVIDTEGGRSRKYADRFDFDILELRPPYRSSRIRKAIEAQLKDNPACIIVDSMSDEHEGLGGLLKYHEEELQRLTRGDESKEGAMNRRAWIKPKMERSELVNALQHITGADGTKVPVILTFRAREKTDQKTVNGRTVIEKIGFVPIAPMEILYALDLVCLLPPRADGIPRWRSEKLEEHTVTKLPDYLQPFINTEAAKPLDEDLGEALARWAKGGQKIKPPASQKAAQAAAPKQQATEAVDFRESQLYRLGIEKAKQGRSAWREWLPKLKPIQRDALNDHFETDFEPILDAADAAAERKDSELTALEHEGTP